MTRRPTGPQAAAILASLSINAALLLGLRQVGNLQRDDASDDREASPLLVISLDAHPRSRPRTEQRAKAPSAAARRHTGSPASVLMPVRPADASDVPAAPMHVVTGADRWDLPGERNTHDDTHAGRFRSTFQHAMDDAVPSVARRPVLAHLAFHDHSFGGFLARLSKMTDCGELQAALANHPGSARTILQTMQRLDCRP